MHPALFAVERFPESSIENTAAAKSRQSLNEKTSDNTSIIDGQVIAPTDEPRDRRTWSDLSGVWRSLGVRVDSVSLLGATTITFQCTIIATKGHYILLSTDPTNEIWTSNVKRYSTKYFTLQLFQFLLADQL